MGPPFGVISHMSNNSNDFKRELNKIAEEFSLKVIKLIQSMPVSQLASLSSAKPTGGRSGLDAGSEDKPRGKPGPKPGAKAAAKAAAKAKATAKAADKSRERRPRSYMADLRRKILTALNESGDWMAASAIATIVKDNDLAFPLKEMRDKGLTEMDGERSKARYRITDAGRAALASAG